MDKNSLIHNSFAISPWMNVVLELKGVDLMVFSVVYSVSRTGQGQYFGGTKYIKDIFGIHKSSVIESFAKLVDKKYLVKVENYENKVYKPRYYANIELINDLIDQYLIANYPNCSDNVQSEIPTGVVGKNDRGWSEKTTGVVGISDHNNNKDNYNKEINNNNTTNADLPTNLFGDESKDEGKINKVEIVRELYNKTFKDVLPSIIKITGKREKAVKSILKDFSIDKIREAFDLVMQSDFLKGKTERKFSCTFDWIFNNENFIKILENKYKNRDDVNIEQKQGLSKDEEMFNGKRTYMRGINRTIIPDDAPPRPGNCYTYSESLKEWKYQMP